MALLVVILFSLVPYANAEPVTQEMAQQTAQAFLLKEQALLPQVATKTKGEFIVSNQAAGLTFGKILPITDENGAVLAYVQELEPQGFIIASADGVMRPILGFSFEGYFFSTPQKVNPLINFIKADIKARERLIATYGQGAVSKNAILSGLITQWGPYIETKWHQSGRYNDKCPIDPSTSSSRSLVGCVAISLGQIVNDWQFPKTIDFNDSDDRYKSRGVNGHFWIPDTWSSQDYPNFNELTNALSNISYSGNEDEEANLLFGLGVKIRMSYSKSSSGAGHSRTRMVLSDDLNYGSARYMNIVRIRDGEIIENRWNQARTILIENLKSGFPAILGVYDLGTFPFDLFSGGEPFDNC